MPPPPPPPPPPPLPLPAYIYIYIPSPRVVMIGDGVTDMEAVPPAVSSSGCRSPPHTIDIELIYQDVCITAHN